MIHPPPSREENPGRGNQTLANEMETTIRPIRIDGTVFRLVRVSDIIAVVTQE